VREPDLAVVDDVDVHDRAAAHHRHGDPGGVGGVLHRVRHELTSEQLGLERGGVVGQGVPDEPAGDRNLVRTAVEATGGSHRRRICRALQTMRIGDSEGRTRHIGLRLPCSYCPY
jgi:hypothetical protein